jgi:hypothetical protein
MEKDGKKILYIKTSLVILVSKILLFFLAEYPFINYYVISRPRQEADAFLRAAQVRAADALNPARVLGGAGHGAAAADPAFFSPTAGGGLYRCEQHQLELFEEVAAIARPPVEPATRRPTTDATGYVVCVYKVFRGDDGEKFERNWLYWTGKLGHNMKFYYNYLPAIVMV